MYETLPLKERKLDIVFIIFFIVNLSFITYIVDIEQIIIADPNNFVYPLWPPAFFVDLVHWWGKNFDPVLMARPVWWKVTIWWDSLVFGPYYAFAIYAFIKGKEWIRIPSIIWGTLMLAGVAVILAEEMWGTYATPRRDVVLPANAAWVVSPLIMLYRMWRYEHPFSKKTTDKSPSLDGRG